MYKIEQNDKLGYYTVGEKIFHSKPQALIEATKTGNFPHWNFSNEIFEKTPWAQDCSVDLREL